MKKTQSFEEALSHREVVKSRIGSIEGQLCHAPNLNTLAMQVTNEAEGIKNYLRQHGGREENLPSNEKQTLAMYRQRYEAAEQQYKRAKEVQEPLQAGLAALHEELSTLNFSCSQQELLSIQEEIITVADDTEKIRRAIADQQSKVENAWGAVPTMQEIVEKRQELLAHKEIGQDVDEELAIVENELERAKHAAQEARVGAEGIAAQAEEVIAGLQRLLHDKEVRAKHLKERIQPHAVKSFLLARAEVVGSEYAKAADALIAKFNQLAALGNILTSRDEKDRDIIAWKNALQLRVPIFPTVACKGLSDQPVKWHNPAVIEAERLELETLGVQL